MPEDRSSQRLVRFEFSQLAVMDEGRIAIAVNQALERARLDCVDRPGLKKARSVVIRLDLTPTTQDGRTVHTVKLGVDIRERIPARNTVDYELAAGRRGMLLNELSPEAVDQLTLPGFGITSPQSDDEGSSRAS